MSSSDEEKAPVEAIKAEEADLAERTILVKGEQKAFLVRNITLLLQCCGSGMFKPNPNFSIPDPNSHQRILVFLTQKIVSKLSEK
jgi:hypothetical protein